MKKLYAIIAASLVSSSLAGVAAVPQSSPLATARLLRGHETPAVAVSESVVKIGGRTYTLSQSAPLSRSGDTPNSTAQITLQEAITATPEGENTAYVRDCYGWWSLVGKLYQKHDLGGAVHIVKSNDGSVYLNNPVSGFPINAWVKATANADGSELTLTGAQKVYTEEVYGTAHHYYMMPMEFVVMDEAQGTGWFYPTEESVYKLVKEDDAYVSAANNLIYGLCELQDDGTFKWIGYGDFAMNMTVQTETATEFPAGVATEQWTLKYDGGANFAEVAVDGSKMYVKGIMPTVPDGIAVGEIKDGKVNFATGQYIGEGTDFHYAYLYGSEVRSVFNEEYGDFVNTTFATRVATFDYVPADKLISNCIGLSTSAVCEPAETADKDIVVLGSIANASAQYLVRDITTPPAQVRDISFMVYNDDYGYGYVDFTFTNLDAKGCILDTNRLFYCVYFDGKVFEFQPDEYSSMTETVNLIPYNFYDYFDFDAQGYRHTFYYYSDGLETIGIQAVYKNEEDKLYASDVSVFPVASVKVIENESKTVTDVTYYDLQGRKVANPEAGLYIVRTAYADGTVSTRKTVIR